MTDAPSYLRTPLYRNHVSLGARIVPFAGWEMPLTYAGQLAEHQAVRTAVGIFDVSHMGQVRITGAGATAFLQGLVPANIASLAVGMSRYSQLVREDGGTIDDLIITRLGGEEFFAVVNASRRAEDVAWMTQRGAASGLAVAVSDESDAWVMVAVQGPEALALLERVCPHGAWSATPAFSFHPIQVAGETHYVSRTGYTGEAGAEVLSPARLGDYWWSRLIDAGAVPCGLAARDSLRLEAGYSLYGHELSETITPIEAGLGWSVSTQKAEAYPGRAIIEAQKLHGAPRRMVAVRAEGRRPLREGEEIARPGAAAAIGVVTSGGFSPGLQTGIALALVDSAALGAGGALVVRARGRETPLEISRTPFVETSLTRGRAQ